MNRRVAITAALIGLALGTHGLAADPVPGVTVEAERQRQQLRHEVDAFVSTAVVLSHADDQTIARWTYKPICPMVAGLTRQQGEFLLQRVSQIARDVGAPLASEHCTAPNLYIVVDSDPDGFIKRLEKRRQAFNREATAPQLARFEKPAPVRTWYNEGVVSIDGTMLIEMLDTSSPRARQFKNDPVVNAMPSQYGSRLNASTVTHDFLSVIEIVDRRSTLGLTMGQLADFVAVAGLAQLDLDKDLGNAPTILNVFRAPADAKAAGVTAWDLALLRALYSVNRSKTMALADMQGMVFASVSAP